MRRETLVGLIHFSVGVVLHSLQGYGETSAQRRIILEWSDETSVVRAWVLAGADLVRVGDPVRLLSRTNGTCWGESSATRQLCASGLSCRCVSMDTEV